MGRRTGVAALAVFWGWFFYGVQDSLAFTMGPTFHATVLLSAGWGLLFLLLVGAALLVAALRPAVGPAVAVVVLADSAAVALGAVLSGSPKHLLVGVGLGLTALAPASPRATVAALRRTSLAGVAPAAVAAVGLVPWVTYALTCASTARAGRTVSDDTWGLDHWPVQTATPLAMVLVAAVAATTLPGRRVAAWSAGAAAVLLGLFFWSYPHLVAGTSRPWAAATMGWGVAVVAAAYLPARSAGVAETGGDAVDRQQQRSA